MPQEGEVRIKIAATALCHTDAYTLGGLGKFSSFQESLVDHKLVLQTLKVYFPVFLATKLQALWSLLGRV